MSEDKSVKSVPVQEIYSWAAQLASESRSIDWIWQWYVWPEAVGRILDQLDVMNGGIIGLVGLQGVGKSSALWAICVGKITVAQHERRGTKKKASTMQKEDDLILFKWRRRPELFKSLLEGTHEASTDYRRELGARLLSQLEPLFPLAFANFPKDHPEQLNIDWAKKKLGKAEVERAQNVIWLEMLRQKKIILIDTPDYSKTDRRLMARDLDEIYWLWNFLAQSQSLKTETKPNLIIAIQKEMFGGHFFFDKMEKIELKPLRPEQMLEAYMKRFKTTEPFTKEALLTLARMSRGIFRRFLRYITLTVGRWQTLRQPRKPVTPELVKEAVTTERLAQDMELELTELFPKQSDLRMQAVRILLHLSETGPQKQSQIAEELNLESYAVSRLLSKLELHSYVTRSRTGTDKMVSLKEVE